MPPSVFILPNSPLIRRNTFKRKTPSVSEQISIAHKVMVEYEKVADVAREFRVSKWIVSAIVTKGKKN